MARLNFELNPDQIAIRNILNNKSFIEVDIYAISNANPNRNKSYFTLESMEDGINTFTDKPILGFFNRSEDFEQHNGRVAHDKDLDIDYWDNSNGEQILGFIREKDVKEIIEREDGLSWIRCTAMICTQYNFKQVKRLLKDRKKKVSVEVEILESELIDGVQYIYKFELLGITILGSKGGMQIREGIEGAHLSVVDLLNERPLYQQRQALAFAYAELNKTEDTELAKEDIGTKGALKVNKSKEAMSDTAWGEVDKTALRDRVVEASNFESVAKDVFLDLREGWEEGEVSKMKYPVMQLKDGDEVVYNRNGLASARGYAEKNNDEKVLEKLKAIYEDLGLDSEEERECDCSQFCDLYEDDCDCKGDEDNHDHGHGHDEGHGDDEEGHRDHHAEGEDTKDVVEETPQEERDLQKECDELQMRCEEYEHRCTEYEERCSAYETRCGEYEARCAQYEETVAKCNEEIQRCSDYDEIKKANECYQAELETMKQQEKDKQRDAHVSHLNSLMQSMGLSAEDVKDVKEKCCNYAFSSTEEIDKEVAYIAWKKNFSEMKQEDHFSVNIVEAGNQAPKKPLTVQERLKNNIKK